ncbi:hypothetical protein GCM10007387_58430 [Pseudoduganella albidiflava]|uniref:Chalcone isomerase domain-containing protein n=2 Tax=Pseudoduganella albidiflava TaxID=321983 RepID=A0AA88C5Z0_9BURK|nr:hypothetical protein GCM10007387_58430 [Pseudoduganella albidiflava]
MIRLTKVREMRKFFVLLLVSNFALGAIAQAASANSTWKYVGAKEYFGDTNLIEPFHVGSVQIIDGKLSVSPSCATTVKAEPYDSSRIFQSLLRQKISLAEVRKYFKDRLQFELDSVTTVYTADVSDCSRIFAKILIQGDRMVAVHQATTFYMFTREVAPIQNVGRPGSHPTLKVTPLPLNLANYVNLCQPAIP